MLSNPFSFYLTLIITITAIKGDFMSINWNASTDRRNSHLEREYKYPMYHKVSPAPCDLTDSCDVFCCQDPDCDEAQKRSFQCSESRDETLPYFDCNSDYHDKPEWLSWFCYVFKNPVYLGKFYATPNKIEKIVTLKNEIGNKGKNFRNNEPSKPKSVLQYGSPIMTYSPMMNSFPSISPLMMKTPTQGSSGACVLTPVKFLLKGVTACLKRITQSSCESDQTLSLLPFLIRGTKSSSSNNTPIVLKSLDSLEGIETEVQVKCIKPKLVVHKLKKGKLYVFHKDSVCKESVGTYQTVWRKPVCENVLAYVHHHFTVNGSDLVKLRVEYGVMNISIPSENVGEFSDSLFPQYIYIKQIFNISFLDVMNISNINQNSSENDDLYSRGYFVGEPLNFGYKSFKNNSAIWRKRFMGVFKNRRSCEISSPVTFGFDTLSSCEILTRDSNCTQIQNEINKIFDNLLRGDSVAAYSNLRPPYNATAPLLRNYPESQSGTLTNSSHCSVPVIQDLLVGYTTLVAENGVPIHRIVGVRVDRSYENVTLNEDVLLTSRVLHFNVASSRDERTSRFWRKMFSPELSENSWLNIFKAFEDVNTVEREQITFWCAFLTISVSAVVALTKLDINLGPARNDARAKVTILLSVPGPQSWAAMSWTGGKPAQDTQTIVAAGRGQRGPVSE